MPLASPLQLFLGHGEEIHKESLVATLWEELWKFQSSFKMPSSLFSWPSVAKSALAYSPLGFIFSGAAVHGGSFPACSYPQLSCQATGAQDSCCFNSPGGLLLQTQFWDTQPVTGPRDSWTVHGLWSVLLHSCTHLSIADSFQGLITAMARIHPIVIRIVNIRISQPSLAHREERTCWTT